MKTIDSFVLRQFQRFSDMVQDWFGKDNFFLAKTLLLVHVFLSVFWCYLAFVHTKYGSGKGQIIPTLLIDAVIYFRTILPAEHLLLRREGFKNISEGRDDYLRLIWLTFLAIGLYALGESVILGKGVSLALGMRFSKDVIMVCVLYLAACTPKPWKTSRIKKLMDKIPSLLPSGALPQPT